MLTVHSTTLTSSPILSFRLWTEFRQTTVSLRRSEQKPTCTCTSSDKNSMLLLIMALMFTHYSLLNYVTVYYYDTVQENTKSRIRSWPGKRVCPVRISAMMHPTDHISTEEKRQM